MESQPLVQKTMADHKYIKMTAIISAFVLFIVVIVFNALAGTSNGGGVFQNNTGQISDLFNLPVTPAGWTFSIWGFIYTWQALWLIYSLTTLCRRKGGTYLYILPAYSSVMYASYLMSHVCNIAWLFAFDGQKLAIGLPIILLQFITLAIAFSFACKRLYENYSSLLKAGLNVDVWLIRMLIQNGIAFYAAWVFVASMLNVGLVMTYKTGDDATDIGVKPDVSGTVVLVFVAIGLIAWFILDIFVVDKYSRYVFSPYITLTVAASGIISKNFDLDTNNRNSIISVILVVLAALFLLVKVVVIIVRQFRNPIQAEDTDYKPTV